MAENKQITLSITFHTCNGLNFLELGHNFMGWWFMCDLREMNLLFISHVNMYFQIRDKVRGVTLQGTEVRDFINKKKLRIMVCSDAWRNYFCMGVCTSSSLSLPTNDSHVCNLKNSVNKFKCFQSVWFFCQL